MLGLYALGSVPYSTRPTEIRYGDASILASGFVEVLETEILQGSTGRVRVNGSLSVNAIRQRTPIGVSINTILRFISDSTKRPSNIEFELTVTGSMTAQSYRKGQEWTELGKGSEVWTHIPNP